MTGEVEREIKKMTVEELIQELQYMDRDQEVRIAQQPSWPFEYDLNGVVSSGGKVWLVEGDQLAYLDGEVKDELGW
jgi:hypothetical protein